MPTVREFWDGRAQNYDAQVGTHYAQAYEKTAACFKKYLKPDPQPDVPSTDGSVEAESVPIDDSQDKGNTIGKNDVYASPLW